MKTESSIPATVQEALEEPTLSKRMTRKIETKIPVIVPIEKKDNKNDKTSANNDKLPKIVNQPPKISPKDASNKNQTEELHLTFCAKDHGSAAEFGDNFPKSTYLGPHPRNPNHFVFSTHQDYKRAQQMKTGLLYHLYGIIKIRSIPENQNYFHKNQQHCTKCKDWQVKKCFYLSF